MLLGITQMPDIMPDYIGRGDENEAFSYVYGNYKNWDNTRDALEWIYGYKEYLEA